MKRHIRWLVSWIGLIVPAGLAFWAFRISRDSRAIS